MEDIDETQPPETQGCDESMHHGDGGESQDMVGPGQALPMATQDLEAELLALPIPSQTTGFIHGSELPPESFVPETEDQLTTAAGAFPGPDSEQQPGGEDASQLAAPSEAQQQQQPSHHADTSLLEAELLAIPINESEPQPMMTEAVTEAETGAEAHSGDSGAGAAGLPAGYADTEALEAELLAIPLEPDGNNGGASAEAPSGWRQQQPQHSDRTQQPQPQHRSAATGGAAGAGLSIAGSAPTPAAGAAAAAAVAAPMHHGHASASGADAYDEFADDLEDYLAAQQQQPGAPVDDDRFVAQAGGPAARGAVSAVASNAQAGRQQPQPQQQQQQQHNANFDDEIEDMLAQMEEQQQYQMGLHEQELGEQERQREQRRGAGPSQARAGGSGAGRPTMEELFGEEEEEEDFGGAAAGGSAAAGARYAAAAAEKARRAAEQEEAERVAAEEEAARRAAEEEEAARAAALFPPQRLAASITGGTAVPVTAASGERVYCRLSEGIAPVATAAAAAAGQPLGFSARLARGSTLLQRPITELLRVLEERELRAAVEASEREQEMMGTRGRHGHAEDELTAEERAFAGLDGQAGAAAAAEEDADMDGDMHAAGGAAGGGGAGARPRRRRSSAAGAAGARAGQLWVDKYAPRHFMSLLSDERTNRQVALWMKDWDECVFGRKAGAAAGANRARAGAAGAHAGAKADTRPQNKVLLIGGPPGLGKTTLAHVVARHCGYHPYEINASDDRTAATLATKIQDAVQMTAVLGGGRPNCVIVDEIDGATGGTEAGGAVAALMKIIKAGEAGAAAGGGGGKGGKGAHAGSDGEDSDSDGEGGGGGGANKRGGGAAGAKRRGGKAGGGGGGGSSNRPLSRPIICIANDLYAPQLRPLRDVARVFHFTPPSSERLAARLQQICRAEGLEADPAALALLVERTERDVRACLNTLQFLARRKQAGAGGGCRRRIEMQDIEGLNIASKDTTQSARDMWAALLTASNSKAAARRRAAGAGGSRAAAGVNCGGGGGGGAASGELAELCNKLHDFGDYDLVLGGLHENLPRVRFMDINLSRTAQAAEAMGQADVLLRSCRRTGDFSAMRFVPPCLATVRALVAQPEQPRQLSWPRLGADVARRASAVSQLVRSWVGGGGADPAVLSSHGSQAMVLELAPALRTIVSQPPLRAVAPNMMNAEEQATLRRMAGVMLHYGLRYCFESPPPPGLQPLQLPETVVPVSNNAIILGLTADVQRNIALNGPGGAAAGGPTAAGPGGYAGPGRGGAYGQRPGQYQQQPQQYGGGRGGPYGGGRGPGGGRMPYNGPAGGRGGGYGGRGPYQGPYGSAAGAAGGPGPMAAAAAAAAERTVPLVPAIDTLHCFTAFAGGAAAGARQSLPMVVRQLISQATETEAIRRAEAARLAALGPAAVAEAAAGAAAAAAGAGPHGGPLKPSVAPPQRQMAGRMPEGMKQGPGAGAKRKGTWMDAFKQQASAKARGSVGGGAGAGAAARKGTAAAAAATTTGVEGVENGGGPEEEVLVEAGAGPGADGRRLPFPVLYQYNEGYTNAVKRPLLVRELL